MRPRLLASDLDGTLLRPDTTVSPRVAAALAAAHSAGIAVVILTARNWRSMSAVIGNAVHSGVVACSNGAVFYDLATDSIVRSHPFELDVLRAFLDRVTADSEVVYAWETAEAAFRTTAYQAIAAADPNFSTAYMASIQYADAVPDDHVVTKVLLRHPTMSPEELCAELQPLCDGVIATTSGGPFVEAMAPGVTKAFALALFCEEHGITAEEVVAVGDHTNDLPMLRWAGRGIAMANAHPSVLEAIPERTASNADDGLALVIEDLLT